MRWKLPEGVSILTDEQRDWADTYLIGSGQTYCFEFSIPTLGTLQIGQTHTKAEAQDISLRSWFSDKPLGDTLFPDVDSMDFFPIRRMPRYIYLGTEGVDDQPYHVAANTTLFLMVQNMQNSENFFELSFDIVT